jgi:septal ring factor EnvC (AmiA/AmiB activator)
MADTAEVTKELHQSIKKIRKELHQSIEKLRDDFNEIDISLDNATFALDDMETDLSRLEALINPEKEEGQDEVDRGAAANL